MTPEERDARTIFVMQLSQKCRARDVEEFFSSVGKIRDVRLIICNKTRRFKGIAYVEFKDIESVALALGLNGQKLLGVPVVVQPSQAEKNRTAQAEAERLAALRYRPERGPMKLYVGSLHFNITEEMLRGIFEPFGKIQSIQLIMDQDTNRSKGYGFITFNEAEDAKKALEQMNGFELAGRPIKIGHVPDRTSEAALQHLANSSNGLDTDELDRSGVDLGASGRLALMAKLAAGTGMKVPEVVNQTGIVQGAYPQQQMGNGVNPPIATQCFLLSNMFDPATETQPQWDWEIRDDVIEECNKHGGVLHIYVDPRSPQGYVYVKCPSIAAAVASVNALHGRWFAGKIITAAYVPLTNYHALFQEAMTATNLLQTRR